MYLARSVLSIVEVVEEIIVFLLVFSLNNLNTFFLILSFSGTHSNIISAELIIFLLLQYCIISILLVIFFILFLFINLILFNIFKFLDISALIFINKLVKLSLDRFFMSIN